MKWEESAVLIGDADDDGTAVARGRIATGEPDRTSVQAG
jgi:hypothetical protein